MKEVSPKFAKSIYSDEAVTSGSTGFALLSKDDISLNRFQRFHEVNMASAFCHSRSLTKASSNCYLIFKLMYVVQTR